ncbi:Fic family protein [Pseudomonas sp. 35 E 8]|uniref:Fic family protein n=1 Tax=Pseudomonas sp. 35 E 8 TaxID=1844103 RepID=UPI00081BFE56|nr:hypothetical protein [Pseudomonas sp. 35 E 8]
MEAAALFNVIVSEMSRQELQVTIGLKSAEHFRKACVLPAIAAGCLEMKLLEPSNSRLQRHRLTATGLHWLQAKIQRSTR